jgi:hypothetical protein
MGEGDRSFAAVEWVGARCLKLSDTGIHPFRPSAARWATFPIKGKDDGLLGFR